MMCFSQGKTNMGPPSAVPVIMILILVMISFRLGSSYSSFWPAVNFINVKRTNFSYERCVLAAFSSYMYIEKRHSYKKFVRKMLMKLTPVMMCQRAFKIATFRRSCRETFWFGLKIKKRHFERWFFSKMTWHCSSSIEY